MSTQNPQTQSSTDETELPDGLGSVQRQAISVLRDEGEATVDEVVAETGECRGSVGAALCRLDKRDVVEARCDPTMPVRHIYSLAVDDGGDSQ